MKRSANTKYWLPDAQACGHRRAAVALAVAVATAGVIAPYAAQAQDRVWDQTRMSPARPGTPNPALASDRGTDMDRGLGGFLRTSAKATARSVGNNTFVYRAEGKRLVEVLQDFAASQGVPAVLADGIEGVVNANFDTKPRLFLDGIARAYNMLWYYDGTALYFYPGRAIQSRMFRLKGFRRERLTSLLKSLDLDDQRYPLKFDERQQTLLVAGPPRHVELINSALESLDAGVAEGAGRTVRVFALRFGSAGDRAMGDAMIPGVATTLRKLYARGGDSNSASGQATNDLKDGVKGSSAQQRLSGMAPKSALAQLMPATPHAKADDSPKGLQRVSGAPTDPDEAPPHFEADEGSNSIIVHGRADHMSEYEALIRRLDQKPQLVELEATIIEVNSDSVDALGVNWSYQSGRGSMAVTPMQPGSALVDSKSFTLGTIIANSGRELLARVNALQTEGKARVLSKPSVMGVANRAAVMREKRVVTVRVAGNLEANLFQIEAGTLLEMTPQVTVVNGGTNSIKLSLYIEDGSFEASVVDQIPIVKKTEIRTEAHVLEGESLLIGGITVESEQSSENGVPGLSRVPFLGALFRSRERQTHRTERMFLITPRLLDSAASARRKADAPADGSYIESGAGGVPVVVTFASSARTN